jgi:hypothetical protein
MRTLILRWITTIIDSVLEPFRKDVRGQLADLKREIEDLKKQQTKQVEVLPVEIQPDPQALDLQLHERVSKIESFLIAVGEESKQKKPAKGNLVDWEPRPNYFGNRVEL